MAFAKDTETIMYVRGCDGQTTPLALYFVLSYLISLGTNLTIDFLRYVKPIEFLSDFRTILLPQSCFLTWVRLDGVFFEGL